MSGSFPSTNAVDSLGDTLPQDAAACAAARRLSEGGGQPPAEVPGFSIERQLGSGAFGTVWLGVEQNTGKQVAIKFYDHRRGLDWALLNREVEKLA
ncbi:MAG TPA: serine/threonine protein kinase, partial [Planctomycetaceae bacterium]|nr:serine/threonine protein kinase [Planctomycetaceae bacterium]